MPSVIIRGVSAETDERRAAGQQADREERNVQRQRERSAPGRAARPIRTGAPKANDAASPLMQSTTRSASAMPDGPPSPNVGQVLTRPPRGTCRHRRNRRPATAPASAAGTSAPDRRRPLAQIASSRRTVALAARQDRQHLGHARQVQPHHHAGSGWRIRKQRLCAGSERISSSSCAVRPKPVAIVLRLAPSALGMKIIVAVCSTSAVEMRLSSASRADCVAKPTSALRLRSVFSQSRMRAAKTVVVERLPALVDQDHRRLAVEPLLDAVEQVHHRRRAQPRAVEQRGHVEAEDARAQVEPVVVVVEQPGVLAVVDPRVQARLRGRPASGRRRPPRAARGNSGAGGSAGSLA